MSDWNKIAKDMEKISNDIEQVMAKMDQDIDKMIKRAEMIVEEFGQLEKAKEPWVKWFAWYPVKDLSGHYHWFEKMYRRKIPKTYVNHDDWQRYDYGTIFDVLKDDVRTLGTHVDNLPPPPPRFVKFKGLQDG